jgi:dihydrofolate reductase
MSRLIVLTAMTVDGVMTVEEWLEDAVAKLKAERDGDLITNGCGELTRNLLAAGLVDEFWFSLHPAVWGKGERPFWEEEKLRLTLLGTETYDSGVVLLRYEPQRA